RVHDEAFDRAEFAAAGSLVEADHLVVLHGQPANRRRHPAVLALVIVDARDLAHLPADREQLEELALVDEVPRVVGGGVVEIRRETVGINRVLGEVRGDRVDREISLRDATESLDKRLERLHPESARFPTAMPRLLKRL